MIRRIAHTIPLLLAASMSVGAATTATAQIPVSARSGLWVGSPLDEYVRLLQLTGEVPLASRMLRPLEHELRTLALSDTAPIYRNPWRERYGRSGRVADARVALDLYEPHLRLTANSAVPFGDNDGVMWAGKGLSGAITIGGALRYGPLTIRLAPVFTWSQNEAFELGRATAIDSSISIYADTYVPYGIDMPQRFGDRAVRNVDPGQSSIQLNGFGARGGVSTENMWWGPGVESSLLMSNNAGGFPHAFLGTERALDVRIGKLELLYTVGLLEQSSFWIAERPDSLTTRWMSALGFVFEPRGTPGLYLGASRVFQAYVPEGGVGLGDLTAVFQPLTKSSLRTEENPDADDRRDQLISLFARWVFSASQAEIYGEFGRNDHSADMRDVVLEPAHASAYSLGVQKLFTQRTGFVRMNAEITSLAGGMSQLVRSNGIWYTHSQVRQGYTNRGQVLGSPYGPGGEGQSLVVDVYRKWGRVGALAQRRRVNTDAYFRRFRTPFNRYRHDVILGFGGRGTIVRGPVELSATLMRQKEYNRYFILRNDIVNVHAEIGAQVVLP